MTVLSQDPKTLGILLENAISALPEDGNYKLLQGLQDVLREVMVQVQPKEVRWAEVPPHYVWNETYDHWVYEVPGNDRYSGRVMMSDLGVRGSIWDSKYKESVLSFHNHRSLAEAEQVVNNALSNLLGHEQLKMFETERV